MFSESIAQMGVNSAFEGSIQAASGKYNVPSALIKAIISTESAWDPNAVNPSDPSYGLMQLNFHYWKDAYGQPILNPNENIDVGTSYLAQLTSQYGPDLSQVISAYNAGHPTETNPNYVNEVTQYMQWFQANDLTPWGTSGSDLQMIAGATVAIMLIYFLIRR